LEEHDLSAIMTQPNVSYYAKLRNKSEEEGGLVRVDNPNDAPKPEVIASWRECIVKAMIITPREFQRNVKELCDMRRGNLIKEDFMSDGKTISLTYELPLSELITDFFDKLKSIS